MSYTLSTFQTITKNKKPQTFKLTSLVQLFKTWNDRRRTRNALHKLDSRILDDIGLSRSDIDTFVERL